MECRGPTNNALYFQRMGICSVSPPLPYSSCTQKVVFTFDYELVWDESTIQQKPQHFSSPFRKLLFLLL